MVRFRRKNRSIEISDEFRRLFSKIGNDIKNNKVKYIDAGKWLDKFYDVEGFWQRRKEYLENTIKGLDDSTEDEKEELEVFIYLLKTMCEKKQYVRPKTFLNDVKFDEGVEKVKIEMFPGFSYFLEDVCKKRGFEVSLRDRFRDAVFECYMDIVGMRLNTELCDYSEDEYKPEVKIRDIFISDSIARRFLLITWLLTEPDAHLANLGLTKFEEWPWLATKKVTSFGEGRREMSLEVFSIEEGFHGWPKLADVCWAKIEAEPEKEYQTKPETEQKNENEKYIELANQFAQNLEDWANPKDETGLRYEYVGYLKPISIALEGFDGFLSWLHSNRSEEGKIVQAAYDKLISQAKVDDTLLESLYEGDEVFSVEGAVNLADTLRVIARFIGDEFAEEPISMAPKTEIGQGINDEWIRVTEAASILGVRKGTVTHWADDGKIRDNKKKKKDRRLSKASVLLLKHKREYDNLVKDAADDLQDRAGKIPDRH